MLSTTYKIIAKLIGTWLRTLLPTLINSRQMEFILGRQILENISKT